MQKRTLVSKLESISSSEEELRNISLKLKPLQDSRELLKKKRQKELDTLYKEYVSLVKRKKISCAHPEYWGENITGRTWCNICEKSGIGDENWGNDKIDYDKIISSLRGYYKI
ncbi:hypothetical protein J4474_00715 [Candidatus Pacearchaeota archaeon]|nr:hypothetical protein [Candidatus Pacearchaeota archaeon]